MTEYPENQQEINRIILQKQFTSENLFGVNRKSYCNFIEEGIQKKLKESENR